MTKQAGINRVPTGGSDSPSARVQIANSLNAALAQGSTNAAAITALQSLTTTVGGDLTGTLPNPTIAANAVTNAKAAQMATKTIKGNNTGGTANALDLTADQTKALLGGTLAQAPVITETGAVATGTTAMPGISDSVPTSSQGDQYLSATITPKSASSTLIIDVHMELAGSVGGFLQAALFQDAGASAIASMILSNVGTANVPFIMSFRHKLVAGGTAATTFKIRAGLDRAGTTTFNGSSATRIGGGTMASSITITEILP